MKKLSCLLACVLCVSLASGEELRGPISIDLSGDGQSAVIAFRKDGSVAIVDVTHAPYAFVDIPASAGIGRRPIKVRCFGQTAVVVSEYAQHLTLIDVDTATVTGQVLVAMYSQDVVWDTLRARYYVSNLWLDRVFVFDASWAPAHPLSGIPVGRQPGPMAMGPDGRLFVGNRASWDVSVVDPDSAAEVARLELGSRPEDLAATATHVLVTNHGGRNLSKVNGVPLIVDDQEDIVNVVTEIDPATLSLQERWLDQGADYSGIDVRNGVVAFSGAASGTVHVHKIGSPPDELQTLDLLGDGDLPGGTVPGSGLRIFTNTRDVVARFADQVFAINHLRDTLVELRTIGGAFHIFGETPLNPVGVPIMAFQPPCGASACDPDASDAWQDPAGVQAEAG